MALTGKPPYTVTFVEASTPAEDITHWGWDFGDGSSFDGQDPDPHLYPTVGVYPVTLHIASDKGSDTFTDTVTVALDPFTVLNGLVVVAPASVAVADFISDAGDYTVFGVATAPGGPYFTAASLAVPGLIPLYILGCYGAFTLELPVSITVT